MTARLPKPLSLSAAIGSGGSLSCGAERFDFAALAAQSSLADRDALYGRNVVIASSSMALAAAALIELDGWAGRIVLCPPDFDARHWPQIRAAAKVEALVADAASLVLHDDALLRVDQHWPFTACVKRPRPAIPTQWALMTSGTAGAPKLAQHNLQTLTAAIPPSAPQNWATFYDIRRFGGLQILLRAIVSGGSLNLRGAAESLELFLDKAALAGVSHISGTPTHWRKALMSKSAARIDPSHVRLSGEIADASILGALRAHYPKAEIAHAYASTEAGVVFAVNDGQPGFPATLLQTGGGAQMRIRDDCLHVRCAGAALAYLGADAPPLRDAEGFVDSGDLVERRGDRYVFIGRRSGIINVGGAKVHPEEVEAVINAMPGVRASLVKARRNPLTGALVAAEVVLNEGVEPSEALILHLLSACRSQLAPHKAPALLRFVAALEVTPAGKLARHG